MGFWHSDEKEKWKEFISLISQETGLNSLMIEKDTLQSYLLDAIFKQEDRRNPKFHNYSAQNESDITELLKEIISEEIYKSDYNNVTLNLLYSPISYDEAIKKGIQIVIDKGMFN